MSNYRPVPSTRPHALRALATIVLLTACCPGCAYDGRASSSQDSLADRKSLIAFTNVRLFDGESVKTRTHVIVRDGVIAAIGPGESVPPSATIVPGEGRTLMPGLIDAHTHVTSPDDLRTALAFGVITELEMAGDPNRARRLREGGSQGDAPQHADLLSAGNPVTAPGGHGTEYGREIPTVDSPAELPGWVVARIEEGSDYIKIMFDDGTPGFLEFPVISRPTLAAAVEAAHAHGRLAIVHIISKADALAAIEAGADGLAHTPIAHGEDGVRLAARIRERDMFVISTLAVIHAVCDPDHGDELAGDPRIARYLTEGDVERLGGGYVISDARRPPCRLADDMVRTLDRAGATILAGSDTSNPGTVHGASLHDELALLVSAGMSPIDALRSATQRPAERFALRDRGTIEIGKRADLVLVEGDPTRDITATRAIVGVWKAGRRFEHGQFRAGIAKP